jgi:hypothetical protein
LVVEPINGRDKVVEELMRGKAVGERIWREEDKGERRTCEGDIFGLGDILVYGREENWERKEEEGRKQFLAATILLTVLFEDSHRGTVVAGNFGLRGQETVMIPRARELERLFLVGWEVTQFGQDSLASGSTSC